MPSPRSKNYMSFATHAIQIFLESKCSITSCILSDLDIFTFDIPDSRMEHTFFQTLLGMGVCSIGENYQHFRRRQDFYHDKFPHSRLGGVINTGIMELHIREECSSTAMRGGDPSQRPEVGFEGPGGADNFSEDDHDVTQAQEGQGQAEAPPAPTCQKKMVMFADAIGEEVVLPYEVCTAKVSYSYKCITNFLSRRNKICDVGLP